MSHSFPKIPRNLPGRQRGFTLLELGIVVGILAWWMVSAGQLFKAWGEYQAAVQNGNKIAKYNYAVASYVANEPARLASQSPPQPFPLPQNHNDIRWLQAPPCAGATGAVAYLPCNFDPWSGVGLAFNTAIAPNGPYISARTDFGPAVTGIGVNRAMGGAIVNAANAYAPTYTANAERAYGIVDFGIDIPTGNIFATVDTAALGVPFLMADGSNQMTGNLNMGNNSVNNANSVNANGNVTAGQDLNAGRNVTANAAGAGGGVGIAGTGITLAETLQSPHFVSDGEYLDKPACPPDHPIPKVIGIPGMFHSGDQADPVTGVVTSYTDAGSRWQVFLTVYTVNNPGGTPGNPNTVALVGTRCGN